MAWYQSSGGAVLPGSRVSEVSFSEPYPRAPSPDFGPSGGPRTVYVPSAGRTLAPGQYYVPPGAEGSARFPPAFEQQAYRIEDTPSGGQLFSPLSSTTLPPPVPGQYVPTAQGPLSPVRATVEGSRNALGFSIGGVSLVDGETISLVRAGKPLVVRFGSDEGHRTLLVIEDGPERKLHYLTVDIPGREIKRGVNLLPFGRLQPGRQYSIYVYKQTALIGLSSVLANKSMTLEEVLSVLGDYAYVEGNRSFWVEGPNRSRVDLDMLSDDELLTLVQQKGITLQGPFPITRQKVLLHLREL